MKSVDEELMSYLERDYRTPLTEISKNCRVSRSTARRRIRSLFKSGHFAGYRVELDRIALGFRRLVYLEVKTNPREEWFLKAIESMDRCIQSDGVIGEYGLVFKMALRDGGDLAERLHDLDGLIGSTDSKRYHIIEVLETYKERGFVVKHTSRGRDLDDLDRSILRMLIQQHSPSPISLWRLSKNIQVETGKMTSKSTIRRRLQVMIEEGVIRQFTIFPRYWSRKKGVRAFIRFRTDPGRTRRIASKILAEMSEVVSLYRTGEDHALFSEVFVDDLGDLDDFLKGAFCIEGMSDTITTIVLEGRKEAQVPMSILS